MNGSVQNHKVSIFSQALYVVVATLYIEVSTTQQSDSIGQKDVEQTTVKIPSLALSKDLLREIIDIIEEVRTWILNEKQYCSVTYIMTNKDREVESCNSTSFLRYDISSNLQGISLRLYSDNIKIYISLVLNSLDSYFTVEGTEPFLVDGVSKKIEDICRKYRKKTNEFFRSKKSFILYLPIGIIIGILYSSIFSDSLVKLFNIITLSVNIPLILYYSFPWIYPKIETEHTKQARIRKASLGIIGSIATGALATLILRILGL